MQISKISFGSVFKIPVKPNSNVWEVPSKVDSYNVKIGDENTVEITSDKKINGVYMDVTIANRHDKNFETFLRNKRIGYYKYSVPKAFSEGDIKRRMRIPQYTTDRYLPKLIEIDTKKFNKVFAKNTYGQYLGRFETMPHPSRYSNFKEYLKTNKPINASEVYIQETNGEPDILFQDGIYRYAVMRDMGFKTIPVAMNGESYMLGLKHDLLK